MRAAEAHEWLSAANRQSPKEEDEKAGLLQVPEGLLFRAEELSHLPQAVGISNT